MHPPGPSNDGLSINPADLPDPVLCKPVSLGCHPTTTTTTTAASPAGIADDPAALSLALGGSVTTFSQPNSATSSLASLLVDGSDLQVTSRQSSASDLGPRPPHSRSISSIDGLSAFSSSKEEALEAIVVFDVDTCRRLVPLKLRSPPGTAPRHMAYADSAPPSPPKLIEAYQHLTPAYAGETQMPGLTIRPTRMVSNTLPTMRAGAYNQYDLGALLAEFKLTKSRNKSPSAGARPPSPQFSHRLAGLSPGDTGGVGGKKASPPDPSRRPMSASPPVAEVNDDEPASMVMIPGVRRRLPTTNS